MTPKEALESIKIAIAEVEWNYPLNYAVAFETTIEALEKQIPKKVLKSGKYNFLCPFCKSCLDLTVDDVNVYGMTQRHCDNCGQALDWSE